MIPTSVMWSERSCSLAAYSLRRIQCSRRPGSVSPECDIDVSDYWIFHRYNTKASGTNFRLLHAFVVKLRARLAIVSVLINVALQRPHTESQSRPFNECSHMPMKRLSHVLDTPPQLRLMSLSATQTAALISAWSV